METCKICGKEINSSVYTIYVGEEKIEKACRYCGFSAYKLTKNDYDLISEGKTYFNSLLVNDALPDSSKEIVNFILSNPSKINTKAKTIVKNDDENTVYVNRTKESAKSGWTNFVKIISIVDIILFLIIGMVIANVIDISIIMGALFGGFIGLISMSLNMLLVEISENISTGVEMLISIKNMKNK